MTGGAGMDRGHPLRRAHGELALLGAATCAARLDFEHDEGRAWIEQARSLAAQLPAGAVLADPICLQVLVEKLSEFQAAVEGVRQLPSGEIDWSRVARLQGELREAVTNAMASVYHAAMPVWARGEAPPWEGFREPEPEEMVSEGAG